MSSAAVKGAETPLTYTYHLLKNEVTKCFIPQEMFYITNKPLEAIILSQILYWYEKGKNRIHPKNGGKCHLAKTSREWAIVTGQSEDQCYRAVKSLEKMGLIRTYNSVYGGKKSSFIVPLFKAISTKLKAAISYMQSIKDSYKSLLKGGDDDSCSYANFNGTMRQVKERIRDDLPYEEFAKSLPPDSCSEDVAEFDEFEFEDFDEEFMHSLLGCPNGKEIKGEGEDAIPQGPDSEICSDDNEGSAPTIPSTYACGGAEMKAKEILGSFSSKKTSLSDKDMLHILWKKCYANGGYGFAKVLTKAEVGMLYGIAKAEGKEVAVEAIVNALTDWTKFVIRVAKDKGVSGLGDKPTVQKFRPHYDVAISMGEQAKKDLPANPKPVKTEVQPKYIGMPPKPLKSKKPELTGDATPAIIKKMQEKKKLEQSGVFDGFQASTDGSD